MKKLLFFALLLVAGRNAHAQNAKVTINNHTDFKVRVIMYGYAMTSCGSACSATYITNVINIDEPTVPFAYPAGTEVWGPNTPCAIDGGVGWSFDLCFPTPWCSALPSDFQWTMAEIDVPLAGGWGTFPVFLSPQSVLCSFWDWYEGPYTSGPWSMDFTWISAGGPLADVVIAINQY